MQKNLAATDQIPTLFDSAAIGAAQARALRVGAEHFLRDELQIRLTDRLEDIKRDFSTIGDLGGLCDAFPDRHVIPLHQGDAGIAIAPLGFTTTGNQENPLIGAGFDLIVSIGQFHRINDLPGVLSQAQQGLKPDGLMLAAFAAGDSLQELRASLIAAEAEITGGVSPRVLPFGDIRDLGSLLQRAGFALPVADLDRLTVTYSHPLKLMADLRAMGEVNILSDRRRSFTPKSVIMRACEIYVERYGDTEGRVPATFDIAWLTGWSPHESQQKPLQPGSGKVSLAEALKSGFEPKAD